MTTVDNPNNLVFDSGGANAITIYTTRVEEVKSKILRPIKVPTSKDNRSGGPKTTAVLDLLRVEHRYNVNGLLDKADKAKLDNLFNSGGPFNMLWETVTYSANLEKYSYTKNGQDNSERDVVLTIIIGGDL